MLKRWDILSSLIISRDLKRGAEIGVKSGENIANILKVCPDFTFYAVDHWDPKRPYLTWNKRAHITHEKSFDKMSQLFWGRIIKLKGSSDVVADEIPNNSLDLVFIDGDHSFNGCSIDITNYLPKLKSGGIMSGHDYDHPRFPGVKKAVDKFFPVVELHDDFVWWVEKP